MPNAVGVGSSGALLGILTAWLVWLLFRWQKIPPESTGQRNCQLFVVLTCVVVTLATSFSPNVDLAAHFGGALMGGLLAAFFFANKLENIPHQRLIRVCSLLVILSLYIYSICYLYINLEPSRCTAEYLKPPGDPNLIC